MIMDPGSAPGDRIVLAGDWHGSTDWALTVITQAGALLKPGAPRLIISLGDFGFWPGGEEYISRLASALEDADMTIWFIDGNHEWHPRLAELHENDPGPVDIGGNGRIWHLPRGYRWTWHGRRWLAVGGAGSVDWRVRSLGTSWWREEVITGEQADRIIADGPADVLISHDCPAAFMPKFTMTMPSWWDFTYARPSSEQLQRIAGDTGVQRIFHGHMHKLLYSRHLPTGAVAQGLAADGMPGNWALLDPETMTFDIPDESVQAGRGRILPSPPAPA